MDIKASDIPVVQELSASVGLLLHISSVPVIVELLLASAQDHGVAIPAPRRVPLTADVRVHPFIVGAVEKREIVDLETRTAPVLRGFPEPVTGVLRQTRVKPISLK